MRALWRYRALVIGLPSIALALAGEWLMRAIPPAVPINAEVGTRLVQLAALLVGLVAWVHNGLPPRRAAQAANATTLAAPSVPTRKVVERPAARGAAQRLRLLLERYAVFRTRFGMRGTLLGLLLTAVLAGISYDLLWNDFANPFAPWLWVATLVAALLTFAGLRPRPGTVSLLPHDPAEPPVEPRVSRREWLILGAILLAAALLRFWDLENIPAGPYIDEADRGMEARRINQGLPVDGRPPSDQGGFSLFGTGWWGVPNLYFWLVGQSLRLFGDNLTGARMVHVLAGIATVFVVYRIGRVAWSPRAGLVAAGLLAVSDFAIHFSRTAGESTITLFTWAACFYYLYKGLRTMRWLDFALSGLAGGLTLYGYVSGKLLPLFLAVLALYLLLRWGLRGARLLFPRLALVAVIALLVYAPNGLYVLRYPEVFTMRYNGVSIFNNADTFQMIHGTDNWGVIIARQTEITYGAFDIGQERGPFYPTHQPILPVPWAALWVLGTAYIVWRVGDVRFAMLGVWILSGLAGAALTNETPALQRVAGMVPTLALVPAVFLDRIVSAWPPLRLPGPLPRGRRSRIPRLAANVALAALVVLVGVQTTTYYFGPYKAAAMYEEFTLVGRYIEKLDPKKDVAYESDAPLLLGSLGPTAFLSRDVPNNWMGNASDMLPLTGNEGKNVHFLFFPPTDPTAQLVRTYYPRADAGEVRQSDGAPFLSTVRVSTEAQDALRLVTARYTFGSDRVFEREEKRIGTAGGKNSDAPGLPGYVSYPLSAEWRGGLVAPEYGLYLLSLTAPSGAQLEIDGKTFATARDATTAIAEVVLARGVHEVRLTGTLASREDKIELLWQGEGEGRAPTPIERRYLWNGPRGALVGSFYAINRPWDIVLTSLSELDAAAATDERRDGVLHWRNINELRFEGATMLAAWRGKLAVPEVGSYVFRVEADGEAAIWIDGQLLGAYRYGGEAPNLPATVNLTAGEHEFEVRFKAAGNDSKFSLLWQRPGQFEPEIFPPTALVPVGGGSFLLEERPTAPTLSVDLGP